MNKKTKILIILSLIVLYSIPFTFAQQCNNDGICEAHEDSANCDDCINLNSYEKSNFAPTTLEPIVIEPPQRKSAVLIVGFSFLAVLIIILIFLIVRRKKKKPSFAEKKFNEYYNQSSNENNK